MTGKQQKECLDLMRKLVSEVQGAPYPGDSCKSELYDIWFEHAQKTAVECFEFLDTNSPDEQHKISKSIDKILK